MPKDPDKSLGETFLIAAPHFYITRKREAHLTWPPSVSGLGNPVN